ncbi:hypothetical protein SAMN05421765_0985 [Kaistella antarctica]|uniref:Uncharacterized protein n=1 Tax=Kaistella antarctica TaxID=266748 RepID=A0A448NUR9_9FLAO|nr:hypothetical protein SAMN05421765_0985 [Kaistella antarctica]VEI01499.1 Uncharacterised protein [Kaistella antarctica]
MDKIHLNLIKRDLFKFKLMVFLIKALNNISYHILVIG